MAEADKKPVTLEELLVSSPAQTDALAKLLIEKGLITREELMQKISEERSMYQKLFNPTRCLILNQSSDAYDVTRVPSLASRHRSIYERMQDRLVQLHHRWKIPDRL